MASYKIRTAGNCPAVFFYYHVSIHNRGDAYSILESDAKDRCRYGFCRRNYSLLQQRKLVSDAEGRCSDGRSRRNHSPLRQRKLESDAEGRCSDGRSRRAILHRHDDYAAAIRKSGPEIKNRCTQKVVFGEILALIRKFGPEIKNRCTQVAVNRENLTSIRKSGLEIKNRCTLEGLNGENRAGHLRHAFIR